MKTGRIGKMGRLEIIKQMRDILEPWITDIDLIDEIGEETDLIRDLGLDSIGILQVILETEKEFGISVDNNELDSETFSMMGNLVGIIQKKIHEDN